MKRNEFNEVYEMAKKTIIEKNEFFCCAGWFWLNLTDKQTAKMVNLAIAQGIKVNTVEENSAKHRLGWNQYITVGALDIKVN